MAGSMLGALLSKVPKAPLYENLDFGKEQADQARANQESLQYLQPLARDVNQFMRDETQKGLRQSLPGAYEKIQENISAALEGRLSSYEENYLSRKSAEEGISRGTSGSQGDKFDRLRDLGIGAMQKIDWGVKAADRWFQLSRSPIMDITSGFVPIQQRMNIRLEEQKRQFERHWLRNKLAAIPQGGRAALIALGDNIEELGQSVLSAYAGGAMGGGSKGKESKEPDWAAWG